MKKQHIHAVQAALGNLDNDGYQVNCGTKVVVIVEKDLGIYLGSFWGMGFWSKLDPVGQPSATCFENKEEAMKHIASWGPSDVKRDYTFHEVELTERHGQALYASIASCVKAGLEGWVDTETPVANVLPA